MSDFDIRKLDSFMEEEFARSGFPGVAVTVRNSDGIMYTRGFGYRNIEKGLPVDGDTIFEIASLSKSVTAFALCLLELEGKVSFDEPVSNYFPDYRLPGTPQQMVTLRHLAMHTSGLPPIQPLEWSISMNSIERDTQWSRDMRHESPNKMDKIEDIIEYISKGDYRVEGYGILGAPGEYMSYSNEGYAILAAIAEKVSGMPIDQLLQERIFKPLGMNRTVLDKDAGEARKIAQGNITSLYEREDGQLLCDDDFSALPPFMGCACIKSTTNDLSAYYQMLEDRGCYKGKRVFPEAAVERLIGRAFPLQKKPYYCLGLRKRDIGGLEVVEHYGGLHGASTGGALIEGGYSVAVFCNEGNVDVDNFMWGVYNMAAGLPLETKHNWAVPNGEIFRDPDVILGNYVIAEGTPQYNRIYLEDGQLMAEYYDDKVLLEYCGGSLFAAFSADGKHNFVNSMEFCVRNNAAWAVRCGERFFIRVK